MQAIVYDLNPEIRPAPHPADTLGAGMVREPRLQEIGPSVTRTHCFTLAAGTLTAEVRQAARGGTLVTSWDQLDLFFLEPTGATVLVRVHDGAGNEFYWDGAAWAPATLVGHWNTPADLMANFSALTLALLPAVGVAWRMTTDVTINGSTPRAYGGYVAATLTYGARYDVAGGAFEDGRIDGQLDDLITRTLLPWLELARPEVSDQAVTSGVTGALDYSSGIPNRSHDVVTVLAVYDLGADPNLRSPLAGVWDAGTKIFTLTVSLPDATEYLARLALRPLVAFNADEDWFESNESEPVILIESFDADRDQSGPTPFFVRDLAAGTALVIPQPRQRTGVARCLITSEDSMLAQETRDAIERLKPDGADGVALISSGSGFESTLMGPLEPSVDGGQLDEAGRVRFDLEITTVAWYGSSSTVNLLVPGGFAPTVTDDSVPVVPIDVAGC